MPRVDNTYQVQAFVQSLEDAFLLLKERHKRRLFHVFATIMKWQGRGTELSSLLTPKPLEQTSPTPHSHTKDSHSIGITLLFSHSAWILLRPTFINIQGSVRLDLRLVVLIRED